MTNREVRRPRRSAPPALDRLRFEPMQVRDLDEVLDIERVSFTTPWSRAAYHRELLVNGCATYLVGRLDDRIVSYGGMWVVLDEAHVTNLAVHPDYRRGGVGRVTMLALEQRARELGARRMTLEVRVSNAPARRLYEKLGYRGTGIRRNYYTDTREDAIVMWKDLEADRSADCSADRSAGRPAGGHGDPPEARPREEHRAQEDPG